jgi:hypothetical protein
MSRSTGESFRLQLRASVPISSAIKSWSFFVEYIEPKTIRRRVFKRGGPLNTSRARLR